MFAQIWSEIGKERGDPFHRCALAHSMADVHQKMRFHADTPLPTPPHIDVLLTEIGADPTGTFWG